jgi:hypothetical protein
VTLGSRRWPLRKIVIAIVALSLAYLCFSVAALAVGSLATERCGITPPNLGAGAQPPIGSSARGEVWPPGFVCQWETGDGQRGEWRISVRCLLSDEWCPRRGGERANPERLREGGGGFAQSRSTPGGSSIFGGGSFESLS